MSTTVVVAGLVAVFVALFAVGFAQGTPDPGSMLRARYIRLRRLAADDGREELAARLHLTRQRFPGKNELWCLQWLVEDLERAKR